MKEYEEKRYRLSEHLAYLKRKIDLGIRSESELSEKMGELKLMLEKEEESISRMSYMQRFQAPDVYTFSSIVPSRYYLKDLFPLRKYEFEGACFYGPNNPAPFLTCCYGDYMQLPPVERRRVHSIDVMFLEEK